MREHNEDAVYADAGQRFFIVADGMGGRSAGEVASAMAVSTVRGILEAAEEQLAAFDAGPTREGRQQIFLLLERAARVANDSIYERSRSEPDKHGMGTTLEFVVIAGGEAFVAHVGDSRTYLVRRGVTHQITVDHTVAQAMLDGGTMTPEEAAESPMRSVLSNAIGGCSDLEVEQVHLTLEPGDLLLVCSDGLHEYVDGDEMATYTARRTGDAALRRMIREALARGGHDNITGVLVEIGAPAAAPIAEIRERTARRARTAVPARAQGPFAGVDDDTIAAVVERVLRETSKRHRVPVEFQSG